LRADADGVFTSLLANASGTNVGAGGTLDLYGYNTTINNLTGTGTIESSHTADLPPRLTLDAASADEFDGQIVGRIAVDIAGAITLTGTNTYTGGTVIDNGAGLILGGETGSITGNVIDNGELISGSDGADNDCRQCERVRQLHPERRRRRRPSAGRTAFDERRDDRQRHAGDHAGCRFGNGRPSLRFSAANWLPQSSMTLTNALVLGNAPNFAIAAAAGQTLTVDPSGGWDMQGGFLTSSATAPVQMAGPWFGIRRGARAPAGFIRSKCKTARSRPARKVFRPCCRRPSTETVLLGGTVDLAGYNTNICTHPGLWQRREFPQQYGDAQRHGGRSERRDRRQDRAQCRERRIGLILDGANTYSGGTTIGTGGVLALGDGTYNGSITGNVVDQGTFVFADSDTTDFTGRISGGGSVFQGGPVQPSSISRTPLRAASPSATESWNSTKARGWVRARSPCKAASCSAAPHPAIRRLRDHHRHECARPERRPQLQRRHRRHA
jgi:hypothetical protein